MSADRKQHEHIKELMKCVALPWYLSPFIVRTLQGFYTIRRTFRQWDGKTDQGRVQRRTTSRNVRLVSSSDLWDVCAASRVGAFVGKHFDVTHNANELISFQILLGEQTGTNRQDCIVLFEL